MQHTEIEVDLNIGYATHAGMTGKHNEDFFGLFGWKIDEKQDFYLGIVADGVGGQMAGEVASHLTVDTIKKYFDEHVSIDDVNRHLERAILAANRAVYQASQENPEHLGMSTTVAVAAILGGRLYTAHVGDSRIYLLRDGELKQISIDHTWAQEAIEAGLLTPQQAKVHPNRNVIRRHLGGGSKVEVDHRMSLQPGQSAKTYEANQGTSLKPGDTLLICSDGLSDMISDEAILASLQDHYQDLQVASKELVEKANQAGGKDNITVVLMQVPAEGIPAAAVPPPRTRRAAGAAVATTAVSKPTSTTVAMPAPSTTKKGMGRGTWLLIAAAGLLILFVIAAGLVVVIGNSFRDDSTPAMTVTATNASLETTLPAGAPATAAILATAQSATDTADETSQIETPGLIPTLRPTTTPTRVRRATSTATSAPPATATATPVPSGGGSGSSSGGSSGGSRDSNPPTSEPPTSEPPTSEPPTSEPPTSEPPTSEPPASEPPPEDPPTFEAEPVEPPPDL